MYVYKNICMYLRVDNISKLYARLLQTIKNVN